jgi:hypothetical protein
MNEMRCWQVLNPFLRGLNCIILYYVWCLASCFKNLLDMEAHYPSRMGFCGAVVLQSSMSGLNAWQKSEASFKLKFVSFHEEFVWPLLWHSTNFSHIVCTSAYGKEVHSTNIYLYIIKIYRQTYMYIWYIYMARIYMICELYIYIYIELLTEVY